MLKFFAGLTACFVVLCAGIAYHSTHREPEAPVVFWQRTRPCLVCDALASRNSAGTMSLFTPGNPIVTGTSISSSWANNTLSDLATELTDSLSRSGKGGMLAPFRGIDGTVAAPAYSFTSEPGTGVYHIGAGDLGWAILGSKKLELTAAGLTAAGIASFNGVLSTPAAAATARTASTATQANITGAVGNNAFAIESTHTINNFLPGLIWYTSDNNATIPKAGVYVQDTAAGSVLILGTSNNYATGITANTTLDQTGKITLPGGVTIGASGTAITSSAAATSVPLGVPTNVAAQTCQSVFNSGLGCSGTCAASASANLAVLGSVSISCGASQVWVCNPTAGIVTMPVGASFTARCF